MGKERKQKDKHVFPVLFPEFWMRYTLVAIEIGVLAYFYHRKSTLDACIKSSQGRHPMFPQNARLPVCVINLISKSTLSPDRCLSSAPLNL